MIPRSSRALVVCSLLLGCCRERAPSAAPPRVEPAPPQPRPAPTATIDASITVVDASSHRASDGAADAQTPNSSLSLWDYRTDGGVSMNLPWSAVVGTAGRINDARTRITPATITGRSGRAPAMRAVRETLQRQLSSAATYLPQGGFNAIGDGRFVATIQRTDRAFPRSPTLLVVVASELDGQAQIEGVAEVPTDGVFQASGSVQGCNLTVDGRELRDIDNDGERELSIALSYCSQPACPTGVTSFAYLAVYDLTPAPRLALMVEQAITPESDVLPKRQRFTRWRDVNRDGHPDLVMDGEDCAYVFPERATADASAAQLGCRTLVDSICCVDRSEVVLYDPAADLWHPGGNGATPTVETPCGGGEAP